MKLFNITKELEQSYDIELAGVVLNLGESVVSKNYILLCDGEDYVYFYKDLIKTKTHTDGVIYDFKDNIGYKVSMLKQMISEGYSAYMTEENYNNWIGGR